MRPTRRNARAPHTIEINGRREPAELVYGPRMRGSLYGSPHAASIVVAGLFAREGLHEVTDAPSAQHHVFAVGSFDGIAGLVADAGVREATELV